VLQMGERSQEVERLPAEARKGAGLRISSPCRNAVAGQARRRLRLPAPRRGKEDIRGYLGTEPDTRRRAFFGHGSDMETPEANDASGVTFNQVF